MDEGDQDAFVEGVDSIPGEVLMSGCVAGSRQDGPCPCHGEEKEKGTCKNCVLKRVERSGELLYGE